MNVVRWLDWRVGFRRCALPAVVHVLAAVAAVHLMRERSSIVCVGVALFAVVLTSAIAESLSALRERGTRHELGLWAGGIAVGGVEYRARRAWLGPGWTTVWLTAAGRRRRLLSVWCGEVTDADYAALRRHLKALDFAA